MTSKKNIFIVSGEASGDLHASGFVRAMRAKGALASYVGWGGDLMKKEGVKILKHYKELGFMGFLEVLKNIGTILGHFKTVKKQILEVNPDVVLLVDYPGFNLRLAKWAKKKGYKVCYYISPTVWAWKSSRVKTVKRYVDKMFVILPFEKAFYKERGVVVEYVGHPLLDAKKQFSQTIKIEQTDKKIVALLPGSRTQEVMKLLPMMLSLSKKFPQYRFVVAGVRSLEKRLYEKCMQGYNCELMYNQTYNLLSKSHIAIVTSGTATLETALFGVPQVVCYKTSGFSYAVAKLLVKVKYISLVNLILDKPVVKELIQNTCNEQELNAEFSRLIGDNYRAKMIADYDKLHRICLENGRDASENMAESMIKFLWG